MPQKILVTGGAGYLGSLLVPELLNIGYEVTVLDSFLYGDPSLAYSCYHPKLSIVRGDVRIANQLLPHLKKADVVIPLAALVGAPACDRDPIRATSTNLDAMVLLLKNLSPNQWVLMPATNSAYGSGDENHHCDENSPLNPLSLYARDKVEAEKRLLEHPASMSFRFATLFGISPRMRLDLLVNDFTYRAVRDRFVVLFEAHFKRNFLHVRDAARAFLHGLSHFEKMRGQVYNVGLSDANLSKIELCQVIQRQVSEFTFLEAPVHKDPDQRNYIVSNRKVEATGFKTVHSLTAGITELIKGFQMYRHTLYGNV